MDLLFFGNDMLYMRTKVCEIISILEFMLKYLEGFGCIEVFYRGLGLYLLRLI